MVTTASAAPERKPAAKKPPVPKSAGKAKAPPKAKPAAKPVEPMPRAPLPEQPFELEPAPMPGDVPDRVVTELRHARRVAMDYSQACSDAIKEQAKKYNVNIAALRRYVYALEADNLESVDAEVVALRHLIEGKE